MKKGVVWDAIRADDFALVRDLIIRRVQINYPTKDSVTLLHYFAKVGRTELFQLLLANKGNLKRRDKWMDTVLHYACEHNNIDIVKVILAEKEHKHVLEAKGKSSRTPIETAIEYSRCDIVELLLNSGAELSVKMMSLSLSSMMMDEKQNWKMLFCSKIPVENVCRLIMLELASDEEDNSNWLPLFSSLLLKDKIQVLTELCYLGAVKPVEILMREDLFAKCEVTDVFKNVLLNPRGGTLIEPLKCLITQDIIFSETDFDLLRTCIKLDNRELIEGFLERVPCLHLWDKDLCRNLILVALDSEVCDSVQLLINQMEPGIINSICISSIIGRTDRDGKESKPQKKIEKMVKHGYLLVDWDYLELFEQLSRRKYYEAIEGAFNLIPLSCIQRHRNQFLKFAIRSKNSEIVQKVKFMCHTDSGESDSDEKLPKDHPKQKIYDNWESVRHFSKVMKTTTVERKTLSLLSTASISITKTALVWGTKKLKYISMTKSPLRAAVKTGDIEIVKLFSEDRENIKKALYDALPHKQVFQYLITLLGIEKDIPTRKLMSKAAKSANHYEVLKLLPDLLPNERNMNYLEQLLERAIKNQKEEQVLILLMKGAKVSVHMRPLLGYLASRNTSLLSHVLEQNILAIDEATSTGEALFVQVLLQGDTEVSEIVLSKGGSPNACVSSSTLCLLHAVLLKEQWDIVKLLFDKKQTLSPSDIAIVYGNEEIAKQLLEMNSNVHSKERSIILSVYFCIVGQHHDLLDYICQYHPSDIDQLVQLNDFSETALHLAVRIRSLEAVKILLKHGAHVDTVNGKGRTALFELLEFDIGREIGETDREIVEDILKILLQSGASLDIVDHSDQTFEGLAKLRRNIKILSFLKDSGNLHTPVTLLEAADYETVDKLVSLINASCQIDQLPQIIDCLLNNSNNLSDSEMCMVITLMITKQADRQSQKDVLHSGIIVRCIKGKYIELTELLFQLGVEVSNAEYRNLLLLALSSGSIDMFYTILRQVPPGFEFRRCCSTILRDTVLTFAEKRNPTVEDIHFAEVESSNNSETTNKFKEILQFLEEKGINLHEEYDNGKTALYYAVEKGDYYICQFLIELAYQSPTFLEKYEKQCRLVLSSAIENCHVTIMQLFVDSGWLVTFQNIQIPHILCKNFMMKKRSPCESLDMIDFLHNIGMKQEDSKNLWITPLHIAVYDNNFQFVNRLMKLYNKESICVSHVRVYDEEWDELFSPCTILQLALKLGNHKMALLLLEHGCSATVTDTNGNTVLHLVAKNRSIAKKQDSDRSQVIDKLVACGCSVNSINNNGESPILSAVLNKDTQLVQLLLDKGCERDIALPKDDPIYPGCTSLHIACQNLQFEILGFLLRAGVSTRIMDVCKRTPLHCICRSKKVNLFAIAGTEWTFRVGDNHSKKQDIRENKRLCYKMVQSLVQNNCELMVADCENKPPVDYAIAHELYDIVLFLFSEDCNQEVLYSTIHRMMQYCSQNCPFESIVEKLLKMVDDLGHFVSQSLTNEMEGKDILTLCVSTGCLNLYRMMKQLGIDECQKNLQGKGAIHILCGLNSVDSTFLFCLCKWGADINDTDGTGRTPLHLACEQDHDHLVGVLLQLGAVVDVQDKYGWTPVHMCLGRKSSKSLSMVLDHAKSINHATTAEFESTDEGTTPLLMAVQRRYFDSKAVELLLKCGADVNKTDKNGDNALMNAIKNDLPKPLIKTFLKSIKDVDARNQKGYNALHIAFGKPVDEIIELLLSYACNPNLSLPKGTISAVEGDTVLHLAIKKKSRHLVETLLMHGASLWIGNKNGQNPVSMGFKLGRHFQPNYIKVWDLILKAGGCIPHLDITEFPETIMKSKGLLELLVACGCKITLCDELDPDEYEPSETNEMVKQIADSQSAPLSMLQLCANAIRTALRPNAIFGVEKLPLPTRLKDFIVVKHITCIHLYGVAEEEYSDFFGFDDEYTNYDRYERDLDDIVNKYSDYYDDNDGSDYY